MQKTRSLQRHNWCFFSLVLSDGESHKNFSPLQCSRAPQHAGEVDQPSLPSGRAPALTHCTEQRFTQQNTLLSSNAGLCHFSGCSEKEETALISVLLYFTHYIYCFLLCSFITNAYCALKLIFSAVHRSWNCFALLPYLRAQSLARLNCSSFVIAFTFSYSFSTRPALWLPDHPRAP